MNADQSQTLSKVIEEITGVGLHDSKSGKFYFNFHLTGKMSETPIEALDLGVRAYNSLKRAGYMNIGDLAEAIASGVEISKIRNCGKKSCREIMEKMFLYQYNSLPQEEQAGYVKEVVFLNASKLGRR
ncbi:MAG: hypothetical protein J5959_14850 [Butyrivibrio sp.]|nr:hypothetical protein [Butyrivibrio sp.]